MGSQPGHWNVFSCHLILIYQLHQKGARYHPRLLVAIYICICIVSCYAAWNNNYSGQEEVTMYS